MSNNLVQKINNLLPGNRIKILTVGVPITFAVAALGYAISRASEGKTTEAIASGVLSLINSYVAGVQITRNFDQDARRDLENFYRKEK